MKLIKWIVSKISIDLYCKYFWERRGYDALWSWFSLSRASFLTMPRALMHEMPDDWQNKMAKLLNEYDDTFPNQPDIGTMVSGVRNGRFVEIPYHLKNYRHPNRVEINKMRSRSSE